MKVPLIELERVVREAIPGATTEYTTPLRAHGFHHLDIRVNGRFVTVRWRDDIRFRIYEDLEDDETAAFDSVPSVTVATLTEAIDVVVQLLAPLRETATR
jgi:hypothetical protein